MAAFSSHADYVTAVEEGKSEVFTWRKAPSQTVTASLWFDLSMSPGSPLPQYYAATPLIAQQMKKSTDGGIQHGANHSPKSKFLNRFSLMSSIGVSVLPLSFMLCDYLLYYPFVDMGTTDEQFMTNGVSLPRYTDGLGVQMMMVSVAPGISLYPTVVVNYTNSDGVAGRVTPSFTMLGATTNGSLLPSGSNLGLNAHAWSFIGLQSGDKGVRSVQSVTVSGTVDVSLVSIVLIKPLVTGCLLEQTAPHDIHSLSNNSNMPRIYDDAYLNLLVLPMATTLSASSYIGELEVLFE